MAKLLVIAGPTASGKSKLALQIAKKLNGEILCADSRTVYRGFDIGTAKPTVSEQREVPHHLLDIVDPDENFTVADFKQLAVKMIDDIQQKGKLPILVGGSGLYIDAVLYDYGFSAVASKRDENNPRHLHKDVKRARSDIRADAVVVGLEVDRNLLKNRIAERIDEMLKNGLLQEVIKIRSKYPNSKALLAPGYKAFSDHINGNSSLEEAKALFIKNDYNLAKRQMTWFRRNANIHWLNNPVTYFDQTCRLLNKLH